MISAYLKKRRRLRLARLRRGEGLGLDSMAAPRPPVATNKPKSRVLKRSLLLLLPFLLTGGAVWVGFSSDKDFSLAAFQAFVSGKERTPQTDWAAAPDVTQRQNMRVAYDLLGPVKGQSLWLRVRSVSALAQEPPLTLSLENDIARPGKGERFVELAPFFPAKATLSLSLVLRDAQGQEHESAPESFTLPEKIVHQPLARALMEEREKILANPTRPQREEAAGILLGVARQKTAYRNDPSVYLALRAGAARLVFNPEPESAAEVARLMWKTAARIEDGPAGQAYADWASVDDMLALALARKASGPALEELVEFYLVALDRYRDEAEPLPVPLLNGALTLRALSAMGAEGSMEIARAHIRAQMEARPTHPQDATPEQERLAREIASARQILKAQKALRDDVSRVASPTDFSLMARTLASEAALQRQLLERWQHLIAADPAFSDRVADAMNAAEMALAQGVAPDALAAQDAALAALADRLKALKALLTAPALGSAAFDSGDDNDLSAPSDPPEENAKDKAF